MFEILKTKKFEREFKQLYKKFPSLKDDLFSLLYEIEQNPYLGTPLGRDCYKIRLPISSKGKGKAGGARLIKHVYVQNKTVYLLSLYDKSEISSLSDKEILKLIKDKDL